MPPNDVSKFVCNDKHHRKGNQSNGSLLTPSFSRLCPTRIGYNFAHINQCVIACRMELPIAILLRRIPDPREELRQAKKTMNEIMHENQRSVIDRDHVFPTWGRGSNRVECAVVVHSS